MTSILPNYNIHIIIIIVLFIVTLLNFTMAQGPDPVVYEPKRVETIVTECPISRKLSFENPESQVTNK